MDKLHPAVTRKILEQIEENIEQIEDEDNLKHMSAAEKCEALEICNRARELSATIRMKLADQEVDRSE